MIKENDGFVSTYDAMPYLNSVCVIRRMIDGAAKMELAIYQPLDAKPGSNQLEYNVHAPWVWRDERHADFGVTHWRPLTRKLEAWLASEFP